MKVEVSTLGDARWAADTVLRRDEYSATPPETNNVAPTYLGRVGAEGMTEAEELREEMVSGDWWEEAGYDQGITCGSE